MIPILYEATEREFLTNGIGRLADCTECTVTEERNGIYECEFTYPITGKYYSEIIEGRIISVTHDENGDRQPFIIYRRSAPINGLVTFNAYHVSYTLANTILKPFTAERIQEAFIYFNRYAITGQGFTFWTDKSTTGNFTITYPRSVWEMLGGTEGSILDVYGSGEYEFDNYTVKLHAARGSARNVTIRYGKNLTDITHEVETDETYNAVVPYWYNAETTDVIYGGVVTADGVTEDAAKAVPMDLSQYFQEEPTVTQLEYRAAELLRANRPWLPNENIEIDFVALWQTQEYENVAPLQRVGLCDTVSVYYPELGVSVDSIKVIKTVYNVLLDRYDSLELGDAKTSFADTILAKVEESTADILTRSTMEAAIRHATDLITGGMGGNVVLKYDADGKPVELLIMDSEDEETAVNVLRINVNGIGFSNDGVNGEYRTAWTLDGNFVADFITSGSINANLITSGVINADLIRSGKILVKSGATEILKVDAQRGDFLLRGNDNNHLYFDGTTIDLETDWLEFNSTNKNVRIGDSGGQHLNLDSDSVDMINADGDTVATFGDRTKIGKSGGAQIVIDEDSTNFYDVSGSLAGYMQFGETARSAFDETHTRDGVKQATSWTFELTHNAAVMLSEGYAITLTIKSGNASGSTTLSNKLGLERSVALKENGSTIYTLSAKYWTDKNTISITVTDSTPADGISISVSAQYYAPYSEPKLVWGYYSDAGHSGAVALGYKAHAAGYNSFAQGEGTQADGAASAALNYYTHTTGDYQTAVGKYNNPASNLLFMVGNGSDDSNRSNAFSVDTSGNIIAAGNITANGTNLNTALNNKVSKTGDTMTGNLIQSGSQFVQRATNITIGSVPASTIYNSAYGLQDSTGLDMAALYSIYTTDDKVGTQLEAIRRVNGTHYYNGIRLFIDNTGSPSVTVTYPSIWRTALGINNLLTVVSGNVDNQIINADGTKTDVVVTLSPPSGYTFLTVTNIDIVNATNSGINSAYCNAYHVSHSGNTFTLFVHNFASAVARIRVYVNALYWKAI